MQSLHRVEKSPPSDGTGGITAGDLSAQRIMGALSICPIPTCISARDDDVGGHPSRHFERSEAEWRNLTPLMTEKPLAPSVISTKAGQPPMGKPLIVQARGQLRLTWRLYAESPQSGEISFL